MTGSRSQRLAAELRERITLGDYGPAGSLESEAELGRRHEVSRVTVRRALEQLRDEGLLASRKGAGWYVVSFVQPLALGTFQHAQSALAEAGVSLVRTVLEYGYQAAPASVVPVLGSGEMLRVRSLRRNGDTPLDVVTEWGATGAGRPGQPRRSRVTRHVGDVAPQRKPDRRRPAERRRRRRR